MTDNRIQSFNIALKLAKKANKPVIYGYTGIYSGDYVRINPIVSETTNINEKAFKAKHKYAGTLLVAYPRQDYVMDSTAADDEVSDDYLDLDFDNPVD